MENSEWVGRSIMQATVSALLAGWFGIALYLPTASGGAIDQGVVIAAIFGFSALCGIFVGPAMTLAWRVALPSKASHARPKFVRLAGFGGTAGLLAFPLLVVLGWWVCEPIGAATPNPAGIGLALMGAGALFVALFSLSMSKPPKSRMTPGERLSLAFVTALIAFASTASLLMAAVQAAGLEAHIEGLYAAVMELGGGTAMMGLGALLGAWFGAASGLAIWVYLRASKALAAVA